MSRAMHDNITGPARRRGMTMVEVLTAMSIIVILAALIIAFNGLGLHQVTELLTRVLLFLPKLLVGLLVIIVGSYFG
ncbi:MAG: prepilin-type N-terminal cleavage/methylation domain-containing protein, partial [Phycisphaerales bacterium]|nr:prepilin-type N-terminal cleavage/methylation domain-containing protein [Phycisphaerales bacterium]